MAATASLFSSGSKLGAYLVRNISVGGALLSGYARLAGGTEVRVSLEFANDEDRIELDAEVLRCAHDVEGFALVALAFKNADPLQRQTMERLVKNELVRPVARSVILVDARVHCLSTLANKVRTRPDSNIALARTPLEATRCLHHEEDPRGAVLVVRTGKDPWALQVLSIISDDFPGVRRVMVCNDIDDEEMASFRLSGTVQAVLREDFSPSELTQAIGA